MVRQRCYVCKAEAGKAGIGKLSYHRLPTNEEQRRIWISLLELTELKHRSPKSVLICSNHFLPSDLITNANGKCCLRPGAVPKPIRSIISSPSTESSASAISPEQISPMKEEVHRVLNLDVVSGSTSKISIDESSRLESEAFIRPELSSPLIAVRKSPTSTSSRTWTVSSVTLTASEREHSDVSPELNLLRKRRKRKSYVGDLSSSDFSTPEKRRKNVHLMKATIVKQRKMLHSQQVKIRYLKNRVTTQQQFLDMLKQKFHINASSESELKASLSGPAAQIFERMLRGPSTQKYGEELRSFAVTLAFYSPKAYNFVRDTFNNSLPDLSTISKWYKSVNGSPGFTEEALTTLKRIKNVTASKGRDVLCNLVLDEMSIRQQVEWTGTKFSGYVDIGAKVDSDILPEAKDVLVFMLVCLNGSWKIPVGYFFLAGLQAAEKSELLKNCLRFLHETGVLITSVTFDGAAVNMSMVSCLGANFSGNELVTHFKHPSTGENVFIFLDACHMIKLIRNTFGSQKFLTDGNNEPIDWGYLVKLVDIQIFQGLHLATKSKIRHLQWAREKMKVNIATQTLSRSVSDALIFLSEDLKIPYFKNVKATATFIRLFNDLFDIFNSRNGLARYHFKRPLSPATAESFFNFLDEMSNYIKGLKLAGIPILNSRRKTGFLGFLVCINSLQKLYAAYVIETPLLKFILTNKLSQDHLELFFSAIRSRGGFNNNPTARQFEAAYKRLLVHTEIIGPGGGNITHPESLSILTYGSGRNITFNENGENMVETNAYSKTEEAIKNNILAHGFMTSNAWDLTVYIQDVVAYIAGFVVKSLKNCVTCANCRNVLESDTVTSKLQQRKQYGRLVKASELVISICQAAEKYFRFFEKTTSIHNKNLKNLMTVLVNQTFKTIASNIFDHFGGHLFEDDPLDGHAVTLVKMILQKYFDIRLHYEAAKKTDAQHRDRIRSMYTKTVLFRHQ